MHMELEPQVTPPRNLRSWIKQHPAGLLCCAIGLLAVAVTAIVHLGGGGSFTKIPDVRMTAPFLVLALGAAIATLARREGAYVLAAGGVVLAAAAMALGWALILAAIACLTAVTILIISEMM